jgi:hypothetical protein
MMTSDRDAEAGAVGKQEKRRRRAGASRGAARGSAASGRYGTTVKKSVTLRETVVEEIEARTGARGFSQFLDAAAEHFLALLKAQEIIDDHTMRYGQFTEEELAEAEVAWRGE